METASRLNLQVGNDLIMKDAFESLGLMVWFDYKINATIFRDSKGRECQITDEMKAQMSGEEITHMVTAYFGHPSDVHLNLAPNPDFVTEWHGEGNPCAEVDTSLDLSQEARKLPGMDMMVLHPNTVSKCFDPVYKNGKALFGMVIHMNDYHGWDRNRIADWIESLDDVPTFG